MPVAVVYARYSSDLQRAASIEDQIRICRERIEREGWDYQHAYTDRAQSGASALRPAYQKLLEDARHGQFEVVVAEALDRLSRDQEDVAGLLKRLRFAGVRLFTLAEGEIDELHVGLKGTMNALFLKDLAQKVRRGIEGLESGGALAQQRVVEDEHVLDERALHAVGVGRVGDEHLGLRVREPVADPVIAVENGHRAANLCRVRNRQLAAGDCAAIERGAHPWPTGQGLGAFDDLWQLAPRHRHPQQRALCRQARLEPAELHQRSGHR